MRRVADVTPPGPQVGQTWVDVTAPGPRPRMETVALIRPVTWTERGTWRGISAELTLRFEPRPGGCRVWATVQVRGRGLLRPLGWVLTRAAAVAVPGDLRRAAGHLARNAA